MAGDRPSRPALPGHADYVVIGAGVHGLSTAYHLARALRARRARSGARIIVIDKTGIAAGASGIACGVVRNNYFQPAMRELMAHSVAVWERHAEQLSYHPVGYLQISPDAMGEDVAAVAAQQRAIGYPSRLIEGAAACRRYMRGIFHDWQAAGITSVLHEAKGGYANNQASMHGLARLAQAEGVAIHGGVQVLDLPRTGATVTSVVTDRGTVRAGQVVIAVGPWISRLWQMLGLPAQVAVAGAAANANEQPMWTYWCLQEGTLGVPPEFLQTNAGHPPPVVHVDTDAPLYSDLDGELITDQLWGIYYKPDLGFGGVQGGSAPYRVATPAAQVQVDPYGPASAEFVVGDDFARMWCSALAFCQARFRGQYPRYKREPSGGIGAFTPDSFPVFDRFYDNCYVIADSNHGYKMIGVGQLVAGELLGATSARLEPFRFSRFASGALHPVSHSPFPWS